MNILLVYPSRLNAAGQVVKYPTGIVPPLSLAILSGLTPRRHTVRVINDIAEDLDLTAAYNLVGISAMTVQSERAYQIADAFRQRGVPVVLGGIHPSALPDEAKQHAEAVVIGEAEGVWEQVLADCERGTLQPFYQDTDFNGLHHHVIPRWETFNLRVYPRIPGQKWPDMPVNATRGCPFGCTFCAVTRFFGKRYRVKPIADVLAEIEVLPATYRFFVDDNISGDPDYARELLQALAKHKTRFYWLSQISTTILKTPDLIELAARAGCTGMIIGLESINPATLHSIHKGFNHIEEYAELFARLRRAAISPVTNVMFGFDEDTPEQFRLTLDFLRRHRVWDALFWMLTPYPGTQFYADIEQAGRIVERRWSFYDAAHLVMALRNFDPSTFTRLFWQTYQAFYSRQNFLDYLLHARLRHFLPDLMLKFLMRRKIYACEHPTAFGIEPQTQ